MYSNEDLERFYFQYQTESKPSGEAIQSFCKQDHVPYNIFFKMVYKYSNLSISFYNAST